MRFKKLTLKQKKVNNAYMQFRTSLLNAKLADVLPLKQRTKLAINNKTRRRCVIFSASPLIQSMNRLTH